MTGFKILIVILLSKEVSGLPEDTYLGLSRGSLCIISSYNWGLHSGTQAKMYSCSKISEYENALKWRVPYPYPLLSSFLHGPHILWLKNREYLKATPRITFLSKMYRLSWSDGDGFVVHLPECNRLF